METSESKPPPVSDSDAPITKEWMQRSFVGRYTRIKNLANQVLQDLDRDEETRGLIEQKTSGSNHVTTVTNRDLFIGRMVEKGAVLNDPETTSKRDQAAQITIPWLTRNFIGSYQVLKNQADDIVKELREDESLKGLVVPMKNGPHIITTVTDMELFAKLMKERGIYRVGEISNVSEGDTAITNDWLSDHFVGTGKKLKQIADEITSSLEGDEKTKGLVINKKSGNFIVKIIADRVLFEKLMHERGVLPRVERRDQNETDEQLVVRVRGLLDELSAS